VQGEKQKRLTNEFGIIEKPIFATGLAKTEKPKILPEDIAKFFADKNYKITPETMREAM
jgi:hypothetical protein